MPTLQLKPANSRSFIGRIYKLLAHIALIKPNITLIEQIRVIAIQSEFCGTVVLSVNYISQRLVFLGVSR